MTRALASLTCLASVLSLAKGDGICQGRAECGSEDDTASALLQLHRAAPASRGPLLQHDPPQIDCRSQPRNGTCWAQQTACELMGMMAQWQHSDNTGIARVKEQLREQCYSMATGKVGTEANEEVGMGQLQCYGSRYFSCVTDVEKYYRDHPGAEHGMKAAKAGAQVSSNMLSLVLKDGGKVGLKGSVVFSFVGAVISNFFPSTGGPPRKPCSNAQDWAECVWEQVGPLVADFLGLEVDGVFADLWKTHLQGYSSLLSKISTTAYVDSDKFPNGTVRSVPDAVRERMFSGLARLNEDMWGAAPFFAGHQSTAAGTYLSMFSALHISAVTTLLADLEHRTPGDVYASQSLILCYAKKVLSRALEARNRRLLLVSRKDMGARCLECPVSAQNNFSAPASVHKCCGEQVLYRDQAQGCSWNEVCGPQTTCGAGRECQKAQPCETTEAEKAYECHKAHVQQQSDAMWEQWLAPIPGWIEMVAMMQKVEVGGRQGASDFEKGNMGTCPI